MRLADRVAGLLRTARSWALPLGALALLEWLLLGTHTIRRDAVLPGALAVAGLFLVLLGTATMLKRWARTADAVSYLPTFSPVRLPVAKEAGFASTAGRIDSFLRNWNRGDEVHALLTELARDRLLRHHGVALEDRERARPLLGDELADYLFAPPAMSLAQRDEGRLARLVDSVEAL